MDLNGARRKNATRETTSMLKQWLSEHRKNPYPTKGEKIMLAIITKMTLTQVSTWFANARRRLKKENKMTWSPRNRCEEDEAADAEAEKTCDGRDSPSDRRSLDGTVSPAFERTGPSSKRIKSESGDDGDSDIVDIEDDSNLDMDSNNHLHRLSSSHHNNNSHHHHHLPSNLPHHLHHSLNHHHNNTSSSGNSNNSAGHHLMKQRRSGSPGSDVGSYSDSDTASQTGGHMVNGSINNGTSGSNVLLGMTNGGVTSPFNNSTGNTAPTTSSSSKPRIWSIADMAAGSKNVAAAIAAHQLNAAAAVANNHNLNINNATCIPGAQVPGGPPNSLGVPPTSSASALHQQMAAALHPHHPSSLLAATHHGLMGHHPGQLGHPGSGLPPHLSPLAAAAAAAAAANHPAAHHLMAAIAGSTPGSNLYHPSLHPSSLTSNAPNLPGGPFGGPPGQTSPSSSSQQHHAQGAPGSSNSSSSTTNVTSSVIPPPPVSSASSSVVAAMSALTGLSPAASMAAFAANQAAWYNSLNPAFAAAAAAANSTNSLGGSSSSSSQSPSPVSPVTSVASSSVLAAAAETSLNRLRAAAAAAAAASLASSNSSSASSSNASSASAAAANANAERNSSSSVNRSSPPGLASVTVASAKSAPSSSLWTKIQIHIQRHTSRFASSQFSILHFTFSFLLSLLSPFADSSLEFATRFSLGSSKGSLVAPWSLLSLTCTHTQAYVIWFVASVLEHIQHSVSIAFSSCLCLCLCLLCFTLNSHTTQLLLYSLLILLSLLLVCCWHRHFWHPPYTTVWTRDSPYWKMKV